MHRNFKNYKIVPNPNQTKPINWSQPLLYFCVMGRKCCMARDSSLGELGPSSGGANSLDLSCICHQTYLWPLVMAVIYLNVT